LLSLKTQFPFFGEEASSQKEEIMEKIEFENSFTRLDSKKPWRNSFFLSQKKNMKKERKGVIGFRPSIFF
jgi:hypothetical protein